MLHGDIHRNVVIIVSGFHKVPTGWVFHVFLRTIKRHRCAKTVKKKYIFLIFSSRTTLIIIELGKLFVYRASSEGCYLYPIKIVY